MTGPRMEEPSWDWDTEPLQIDLALSDVMSDLDPRWEDWARAETVTA